MREAAYTQQAPSFAGEMPSDENPKEETKVLYETLNPLQNLMSRAHLEQIRAPQPKLISLTPHNYRQQTPTRYRVPRI